MPSNRSGRTCPRRLARRAVRDARRERISTGGREGSLEAPTRHPIDWQNPAVLRRGGARPRSSSASSTSATAAGAASASATRFPTLFDAVDASPTGEVDGVRQEGVLGGRGSLLPLRHVLHDEVSVRSAASVERGLPAPDAAREGRAREEGRRQLARQGAGLDRCGGQHRGHSGRRRDRERGQQLDGSGRALLEKTLGVDREAPVPEYHSNTARKRARATASTRRRAALEARPTPSRRAARVARVHHLLRQSQRARARRGPRRGLRAQRHRRALVAQGALLRHAEARARRPRSRSRSSRSATSRELMRVIDDGYDIVAPMPSCVLMFKQELPLLFPDDADVQAVARAHLRSVRVPDAAASRRACCARISSRRSARSATTCRATCACRTSG